MEVPAEWEQGLRLLLKEDRRRVGVVVIGAIDTGKTTFCTLAARSFFLAGFKTGVVDADLGQSDIGLPGMIGLGFVESPIDALSQVACKHCYCVGSLSPVGHLLPTIVGAKLMWERAFSSGCQRVIVDTDGLVDGPTGWSLKYHLLHVLQPDWVVLLERNGELSWLRNILERSQSCRLVQIPVPPQVRSRGRGERRRLREDKFKALLSQWHPIAVDLSEVRLMNVALGLGRPVTPEELNALIPVTAENFLGAWQWGRRITALVQRVPIPSGELRVADFHLVFRTPDEYEQVVVGILDSDWQLIEAGLSFRLDWQKQVLTVLASGEWVRRPKHIYFGRIALSLSGEELGHLAPDGL